MNAVEIEEAVSELVESPFDPDEFPFQFLAAFGMKPTTIKRLRSGAQNKSDVAGGVLQRNNIHIAVCEPGLVEATVPALRESPATASQKAKFILVTDGQTLHAENMFDEAEPPLICEYTELGDHFGYFLALAGITTVKQIRENAFDIKATSRLNKLYVELLKQNPDWEDRREELNHFFARLIFCFFAEDTQIFSDNLFTETVAKMSESDGTNTHEIISELFKAMNTPATHEGAPDDRYRDEAGCKRWARPFPYVNGGLFSGSLDVPRFSKIARSYLIHIGGLDWTKINPDIFGSMIQAVAEDEERGELGMHYTSVPNILKVLNPLFLDELRDKLAEAGDGSDQGSKRKLLNLRNRIARIRVFDPACGSGNFLVIAYKHMREIEAEVNRRRGEPDRPSDIPLTNFRGIEIRHFASEIARLALIIAEYQCDVLYRGQKLALAEFLPLEAANWITHGNALRLDWLGICPPAGTGVRVTGDDLFEASLDQPEIDFENQGGETYICSNPPYLGRKYQSAEQKHDLKAVFGSRSKDTLSLDYVSGWFMKAADFMGAVNADAAFVSTNSICQGIQVPTLWPVLFGSGVVVSFAYHSFHWSNLASRKAGVTVVIVGMTTRSLSQAAIYTVDGADKVESRLVSEINGYLVPAERVFVQASQSVPDDRATMRFGNHPYYANALMLRRAEKDALLGCCPEAGQFLRPLFGSKEFIDGYPRYCLWIDDETVSMAQSLSLVYERIEEVRDYRLEKASDKQSLKLAESPHRFRDQYQAKSHVAIVPIVSAEARYYLPAGLERHESIIHNKAFALYDPPLWNLSVILSRLHRVWIGTVCARLRNDPSYSNTLGWNTFPIPPLTEQNRADLTRCAENILLARESYWPATIADMYNPDEMGRKYPDLRAAHDANDETLERIYIGRRFKNDTERLEKLFAMYTEMIEREKVGKPSKKKTRRRKKV